MVAATGSSQPRAMALATPTASPKNISLDRKPLKRGTPAMAEAATMARVPV